MRREWKVLLGTMALGAAAAWGPRGVEAVAALETFRVADITVAGEHYLSLEDVLEAMGRADEAVARIPDGAERLLDAIEEDPGDVNRKPKSALGRKPRKIW